VKKQVFGLVCVLLASSACVAQRVQWQAFRLTEDNDFLGITQRGLDRYYTQGLRFEFLYKTEQRKFFEKTLIPLKNAENNYSVGIAQQIYTPSKIIQHPSTFVMDEMPYVADIFLTSRLISFDTIRRIRFNTALQFGFIGPMAIGERTQLLFHKIIGSAPAVGWDTQMRNDILLNYSFRVEKEIAHPGLLRIDVLAEANAGTTLVSAVTGINLRLGTWYKPGKFSWELFFLPEVRAIAYNALLQGGILNKMNASENYTQYFLNDIKPLVYSHSTGFQVRYLRWELLYRQVNVTREFSGQLPHYYGNVTLTFWFRKGYPTR
jgi:lipid A 3-O-deacylase